MVASSEQHNAPVIVKRPATVQASNSQPGEPIRRADSAEVMNTPEPIIDPITIMVASSSPRRRSSCGAGLVIREVGPAFTARLLLAAGRLADDFNWSIG